MSRINNLRYATHEVTPEDEAAVLEALRSDWLTCGPRVDAFEAALCKFTGARYAVAVSSGTAALHLALLAAGLGPGDCAATSPLSFVASANAILYTGARPLFLDVEPGTGNVSARTLAEAQADPSWPGIKALVPVHYAGRPCDVDALQKCTGKGVAIIEDACHAFGACETPGDGVESAGSTYVGACRSSLAAAFSLHPTKPLTACEGGVVTTNDQGFADEVRSLRNHGRDAAGRMVRLGVNARLSDVHAALGLSQLARVEERRIARRNLVAEYAYRLSDIPGVVVPPMNHETWRHSSHHLYPVRIKDGKRDHVKAYLNERGIQAQVHYPSIPGQPFYRELGYDPADYPEALAWSEEELSLPLHAQMDEGDVLRVVGTLREALA